MSSSILVLPEAPASPWVDPQPGVAAGRVDERSYPSARYGTTRRIWVYTPPGATDRPPAGLLVCLWGMNYLNEIPVPTILDNLLNQGRIPPLVAIFVDNDGDRFQNFQSAQRFTESMSGELIPWARTNLRAPADPRRIIVAGYSASGLASAYAAFRHPELVGNVLSQSGAFWRGFEGEGASEPEWLAGQYAAIPKRDTRFYIDVGEQETRAAGGVFRDANRRLRDVLVKKGYAVSYREVPGGEHEFIHWRTTFGDGLVYLTSGWAGAEGSRQRRRNPWP
jgi:enterochelin esterase family protein